MAAERSKHRSEPLNVRAERQLLDPERLSYTVRR